MSAFTITIADDDALLAEQHSAIEAAVTFAIETLDRYLSWQGVMDIEVVIEAYRGNSEPNGLLPSLPAWVFDENNDARLASVLEAQSGIDANGETPDMGFTIYLGSDGSIRNYGASVWIDPNPQHGVNPNIPTGSHDFISIAIHELLHTMGFATWASADAIFDSFITGEGNNRLFSSENVSALLGGDLPFQANSGDHYGNSNNPYQPITSGIMYHLGNYADNRWHIGLLDLWLLEDFGWTIENSENLPLVDTIDSSEIQGSAAADSIDGDSRSNSLFGHAGDDIFNLGLGNDMIDGGSGLDQVIVNADASQFTIKALGDDFLLQSVDGSDGVDILRNIERIAFNDQNLALDTDGTAGYAYRIYKAAFDRIPDSDGLGYWIAQMDAGMELIEVSARFIDSDEFRLLYGESADNEDFLLAVYQNVLDRAPDDDGYAWWIDQLENNPEKTWDKVLADFSESVENQDNVQTLIANGINYELWIG